MAIRFRLGLTCSICALSAFTSACSTAKVENESQFAKATTRPQIVYVGNFDLGSATIQNDPGTLTGRPRLVSVFRDNEDPAVTIARLEELLANDIVDDLTNSGQPAQRLDVNGPSPTQGWLVTGEFLEVNEGNRMQRAVIGFGVGNSDAKLYVSLADLAHPEGQDLLDFNANAKGNQMPGGSITAVADHSPWGMVAMYALQGHPSEKDIKQIAKAISQEIIKAAGSQ